VHVAVLTMFVAIVVVVSARRLPLAVIVGRGRVTLGPPGFLGIDSRGQREAQ